MQNESIKRKTRLQDLIREYFSQRTAVELKNQTEIKSELRAEINSVLSYGEIKEVAFTSFDVN